MKTYKAVKCLNFELHVGWNKSNRRARMLKNWSSAAIFFKCLHLPKIDNPTFPGLNRCLAYFTCCICLKYD